jgi:hypothetical protein
MTRFQMTGTGDRPKEVNLLISNIHPGDRYSQSKLTTVPINLLISNIYPRETAQNSNCCLFIYSITMLKHIYFLILGNYLITPITSDKRITIMFYTMIKINCEGLCCSQCRPGGIQIGNIPLGGHLVVQ